jgi:glycerophosphoryl diester phosphodiesterase
VCGILFVAWYNGFLAFLYADYPERSPVFTPQPNRNPLIIAHRGDEKSAPENTLPAIEAAIAKQVDFFELDIRLTSDGIPVLMHDRSTERTTNKDLLISETLLEELRTLDAGSWFAPEFKGAKIPTLEDALDLAQGKICLFADIKSTVNLLMVRQLKAFAKGSHPGCLIVSISRGGGPKGIDDLGDLYKDADEEIKQKVLSRAEHDRRLKKTQLATFMRYWPGFPLIQPYKRTDTPENLLKVFPNLVAVVSPANLFAPDLVNSIHAAGLWVIIRTAQREDVAYRKGLDTGIDGIWVSNVDSLQRFLEGYRKEVKNQ